MGVKSLRWQALLAVSAYRCFGPVGIEAVQLPEVLAISKTLEAGSPARGASTHTEQVGANRTALVCEVVYLNLNASVGRRLRMEGSLRNLGLEGRRFPAYELEVEQSPSGAKNFTPRTAELLLDVFSEWSCGSWAEAHCEPGDQLCCIGITQAIGYGLHATAGVQGSEDWVELTTLLSNLAAFVAMLKQMRRFNAAHGCAGVIILEDDARLDAQWQHLISYAVSQAPDFSFIKLQSEAGLWGSDPSASRREDCLLSHSGDMRLYDLGAAESCSRYSTAAQIVNWRHVERMLTAIEMEHHARLSMFFEGAGPLGLMGPTIYCFDMLLPKVARHGLMNVYDVDPPAAYVDGSATTFS